MIFKNLEKNWLILIGLEVELMQFYVFETSLSLKCLWSGCVVQPRLLGFLFCFVFYIQYSLKYYYGLLCRYYVLFLQFLLFCCVQFWFPWLLIISFVSMVKYNDHLSITAFVLYLNSLLCSVPCRFSHMILCWIVLVQKSVACWFCLLRKINTATITIIKSSGTFTPGTITTYNYITIIMLASVYDKYMLQFCRLLL